MSAAVTFYVGNYTNAPNTWVQYWPSGEPWAFFRGNNLWHAALLNSRLQPIESYEAINNQDTATTVLFQACPGWGFSNSTGTITSNGVSTPNDCATVAGSADNGNLAAYDEYLGGHGLTAKTHFSQSFLYDNENRLSSASDSGGWSRGFAYDKWGNMAVTTPASSAVPMLNVNTPVSTAQYNANNQRTDQTYDANGNLQSLQPGISLTYDAENRQLTAGAYSYTYDGGGHRVTKTGGGVTINYVYDAAGQLAAEYSNVTNTSPCTTCYLSYDHLGTVRLVTDQSANVISRHDYLPFGEEITNAAGRTASLGFGATDDVSQRFTGKERDSESGLDYFGARYYGSALGRFTSPDPMGGHYEDPQTLNRYAYVRNNPLTLTDPTGLDIWLRGCGKDSSTCQGNYVGTTDKDGNFTRTHLTGDQTKDATLGAHGISVTQDGKQYQGVWDTNKGENGTVTVAGEGALKGYNADVNGNCGGTCVASGEIRSTDPKASDITQALFGVLSARDSGYVKNAGTDALNFFHPGATNFRGHTPGDPKGLPSTHIPMDPKLTLPNNEWHVDGVYPYDGVHDWLQHAGCATHVACDPAK